MSYPDNLPVIPQDLRDEFQKCFGISVDRMYKNITLSRLYSTQDGIWEELGVEPTPDGVSINQKITEIFGKKGVELNDLLISDYIISNNKIRAPFTLWKRALILQSGKASNGKPL